MMNRKKEDRKMNNKKENHILTLWGNKFLWFVICTLVASLLTWIRPVVLSEGGEITYFSLLMAFLIGYIVDWKAGFIGAAIVGFQRFAVEAWIIPTEGFNLPEEALDIIVGYVLLAVGGLLIYLIERNSKKKHKKIKSSRNLLLIGFAVGVLLKYVENVAVCLAYHDEGFWYAVVYYIGYIGTEAVLSIAVLFVPAVVRAIDFLREVAHTEYQNEYDLF